MINIEITFYLKNVSYPNSSNGSSFVRFCDFKDSSDIWIVLGYIVNPIVNLKLTMRLL